MADHTPETQEEREARWWSEWWDADYSWDGLAKKEILGGGIWGEKTLQDFWRRDLATGLARADAALKGAGELIEFDGRWWHIAHLPVLSRDESAKSWKADEAAEDWGRLAASIRVRLAASEKTRGAFRHVEGTRSYRYAPDGADGRARFDGAVLSGEHIAPPMMRNSVRGPIHLCIERGFVATDLNITAAEFGPGTSFDGATFVGCADFSNTTFSSGVSLDNATFIGDADFANAIFSGDAGFDGASFFGGTRFDNARFIGVASFSSVTIAGVASFYSVTFSGEARFERAFFFGDASFNRAAFSSAASFGGATWLSKASFYSSTFSGAADFEGVTISGGGQFNAASFSGDADFSEAVFSGDADFQDATFSAGTTFDDAVFSGFADFDHGTFSGYADFRNATFSGDASFDTVVFFQSARFNKAKFFGYARFDSATFTKEVGFDGVVFSGYAKFDSVTFDGRVSFGSAWEGAWATFETRGSFQNAVFKRQVVFEATVKQPEQGFAGAFYGARLVDIADFSKAGPVQSNTQRRNDGARMAIAFSEALFEKTLILTDGADDVAHRAFRTGLAIILRQDADAREDLLDRLEAGCRTVKIAMGKARDEAREQRYYRFQLRARHARADTHRAEKTFGRVYGVVSGYGGSLGRPLAWLGGVVAVSAIVYWITGCALVGDTAFVPFSREAWGKVASALNFSLSRSFFLSAWPSVPEKDSATWQYIFLNGHGPGWGLAVRLIAAGQSILSGALIFLFALAVRRKFQIGG